MNVKQKPAAATALFAGAVIAVSAYFIGPWEGERRSVYADIVGIPTVCFGHTGPDVKRGQPARTGEQCAALLEDDIGAAWSAVQRCIATPITVTQASAFTSLTFNAGPGAVCGSTLQRKANAGDMAGACAELRRWVYAGGKRVQGLVNRREAEFKLCMEGMQ